ncbi:MAG: sugar ABC transporter ATP-binding protein [Filifactor alocis]|nr:sugar ABC transporter ATP-binding protein [Filifactor alocis]
MKEILRLEKISKHYAGVQALKQVSMTFREGGVYSIIGENGAGKSTLIQVITGAVSPSEGDLYVRGEKIEHMTPMKSRKMKIAAVYQELNLIPELAVYQNIFYARELKKGFILDEEKMKQRAKELLEGLHVDISVDRKVKDLGIGSRQVVEIAKALVDTPDLILFDEPTASLSPKEAQHLHKIIENLSARGIAVIFVSHKLDEVLKISDTICVLRDGQLISVKEKQGTWEGIYDIASMVRDMLGKKLSFHHSVAERPKTQTPILELKGVSTSKVHDIDLCLYRGEILSLSGMLGSMRTEVLSAIFGIDPLISGEIFVEGKKLRLDTPGSAIRAKIGYITEDRKDSGLFMELSIRENMSISSLPKFKRGLSIDRAAEEEAIVKLLDELNVKYSSLDQKVKELSGGNQQKIALGKWLMASLDILLLDEPTRGVDVGAKEEIYRIIDRLSDQGKAILMVSSEMEEVLRLSDRTLVMNHGRLVSEYAKDEITAERILQDSSKFISEV